MKKDTFCILAPNIVMELPTCHPFGVQNLQVAPRLFLGKYVYS